MTGESTTDGATDLLSDAAVVTDPEEPSPVVVAEVADPSERSEIDRIDPDHQAGDWNVVTLTDGTRAQVRDLKTREFFALLRIVTRGSTPIMHTLNLDPGQGIEAFTAQMIALMAFSVPEADQETIDFVRMMVYPADPEVSDDIPEKHRARVREEARKKAALHLDGLLANPELDDSFAIIEAVVRREAPDLLALGKRLAKLLPGAMATEQEQEARQRNRQSQQTPSLEASPEPST